jgi:hypothetical protein
MRRSCPLFLSGPAGQSVRFAEEFMTGFEDRFPALLDLRPWSAKDFVLFNLGWLTTRLLAAAELHKGYRVMLFAVWFFAIAFMVNGLARPVLAVITRGSFPGLISSPVVGLMGVLPWRRFYEPTKAVA